MLGDRRVLVSCCRALIGREMLVTRRAFLEREQVARRIDDAKSATVGGSGLQSYTRLVEEFIHQRL